MRQEVRLSEKILQNGVKTFYCSLIFNWFRRGYARFCYEMRHLQSEGISESLERINTWCGVSAT
jgi:hypothetical protein